MSLTFEIQAVQGSKSELTRFFLKKTKKKLNGLYNLYNQFGQFSHLCNIRSIRCYLLNPFRLFEIRSFSIRMIRFLIRSDNRLNGFHRSVPLMSCMWNEMLKSQDLRGKKC